ncbi:MAG: formylglycine-generating enzyme family protein [Rhodobacterales bacterium]|nr:formylglycine-generating enzyme family protein [Rhodobacterales bacterium]
MIGSTTARRRTAVILRGVIPALLAGALADDAAMAQGRGAGDVVTLRNGEIYQGVVAQEQFTMETPWGTVALPYGRVARLQVGRGRDAPDRLWTHDGSRFSGRLAERRVTVLRVLDPTLPVALDDITDIAFAPLRLPAAAAPAPDLFEMRNDDRFRGRLLTSDLMARTGDGLALVPRRGLRAIDLDSEGDDGPVRLRLSYNTPGRYGRGELMGGGLDIAVAHADTLTVAPHDLRTVQLGAAPGTGPALAGDLRPMRELRDTLRDGTPGPRMVVLRGGTFRQGSDEGVGDFDEHPALDVTLARPFAMALHPVTFEDYDRYCAATGVAPPDDSGWGRGARPVINVSWEEAQAYARWISERTGRRYRLPTEAEWEYAVRAGTATTFWWGEDPTGERANCAGCGGLWDGEKTAPVGRYRPNPFGLYDMAGNVFHWMADCYHDSMAGAPGDGTSREKAAGCGKRVIRGGAWSFPPKEMRSANKWRDFPSRHSDDTGFRLVRDMEENEE